MQKKCYENPWLQLLSNLSKGNRPRDMSKTNVII